MPVVKAKHRETVVDISIVNSGNISALFDMCLLNDIALTKDLVSGEAIQTATVVDQATVNDLASRKARPCRAIEVLPGQVRKGIGYWKIFGDFIVS